MPGSTLTEEILVESVPCSVRQPLFIQQEQLATAVLLSSVRRRRPEVGSMIVSAIPWNPKVLPEYRST
jgi:hypothetical protein